MTKHGVFVAALHLSPPWDVVDVEFEEGGPLGQGHLLLRLDFPGGSRFPCPTCARPCAVHDTRVRRWRHLNFFEHETILEARVPRTKCEVHGVHQVPIAWGRERGGFTELMCAHILLLAREMPMRALARALNIHDTRLWRLVSARVAEARRAVDMSEVKALVADETSRSKGQEYATLFVEPGEEEARVLYATAGRDHTTFTRFAQDLEAHGGDPKKIRDVCMDMSAAFRKGAEESLPNAEITYDRFHVAKLAGEGVDEVRRGEQAQAGMLTSTRYIWLKNPQNWTDTQAVRMKGLSKLNLATMKAYHMRLNLGTAWEAGSSREARHVLSAWRRWVHRSSRPGKDGTPSLLEPMARVARTIKEHTRGILNYFRKRLTSGVIEGLNSYVQAARARARGYRNPETFKTMIYLLGGRLKFNLPGLPE